ncbi:MAG: hypothetical protein Q9159_007455 [Coniocarpon cinnabarinum]
MARPAAEARNSCLTVSVKQAKALIYHNPGEPKDVLSLHSHSISPPHSDLVTAKLLAAPLNPADINTIQGTYPSQPAFTTSLSTTQPAAVPGNEGVAVVSAAGSGATSTSGIQKADWLIMKAPGIGTWRTALQAPSSHFLKLGEHDREGITPTQAATVSVNPCTAWAMLRGWTGSGAIPPDSNRGEGLKPGEWFVQNGANSGVGRAAIQLARQWGAKSINMVRSRPGGDQETAKLKQELHALGADVVLTEDEANAKGFSDRINAEVLNNGRDKIKLALNCVGGKSALNQGKILAPGSTQVTYGAMAKQPLSVPAGMLIFRDLRFAGFWVSKWAENNASEKMRAVREVLGLIREGKFRDVPMNEIQWDWGTEEGVLRDAVQGTLEGFKGGKGIFVFGET